ncbi:unnamed protein product (macronuclear) [Paramecium tetraurelia]|uniref:TPX2 C-terminal domain-containing protein n=1 Tax=Paramecium tetraurelia TaxID=5888 RepID=A0BK83_PARTE|nr:uncharacterized protein GSPATT00029580001 [Paramecium tetraurelia]CAK58950.1 unnamed protein product [Paramecium tetraurelia]|eukprot:XP_001426348.1 hypothetical protein (macronuclear) [Paramecium tetraurelia strain d4-2]
MNQLVSIDSTLQANLERLSYLMAQKKEKKPDFRDQFKTQTNSKKIFVNLRAFVKQPQPPSPPSQNQYKEHKIPSQTITTQTQTPKTPTYRQQFIRQQSLAQLEPCFRRQEISASNIMSERTDVKASYKNWVGLSVIERNELFLKKKQQKLQKMRVDKDEQELSKCTFSPHFYNPISIERPSSCCQNKSYQDIHKQRKNQNEKLY